MTTGVSILGTHMMDLLSKGSPEVATFGNLSNIAQVRLYDHNNVDNGYIISKSNADLHIYSSSASSNTHVGIGTTVVDPDTMLQVDGRVFARAIGTQNDNNMLPFNFQSVSQIKNIYITGNIYQNGVSVLSDAPSGKNVMCMHTTSIISSTTNVFTLTAPGLVTVEYHNIDLFINGIKYIHIDDDNYDYMFTKFYNGKSTAVTISLIKNVHAGDVVDITIWYGSGGTKLNLVRMSAFVSETTNLIEIPVTGNLKALPENCEVFINGFRYCFVDGANTDFTMTYNYDGSFTVFSFALGEYLHPGDVIDISVWHGIGDFNFVRYTEKISSNTNTFSIINPGISTAVASNVKIFINGVRYSYVSTTKTDFGFFYTNDGSDTTFFVTLDTTLNNGDVVDITIYFGGATGSAGVGAASQWGGNRDIYFTAGNVGIGVTNPSVRLEVSGDVFTTGNVSATGAVTAFASDRRLKTILDTIDHPLEKVKHLSGVRFMFNDTAKSLGLNDNDVHVGLIAQDVQGVLPEVVKPAPFDWNSSTLTSISGSNYLTIQYEKIVPLLIEAIKEQSARIEALEARLA